MTAVFIDPKISLDEASHTYSLSSQPEIEFTSCTTFISEYFEKFDGPAIAANLVERVPKYRGRTVESLLEEWAESANHGTAVHKEIEDYINDGSQPNMAKSIQGVQWLKEKVNLEKFTIYPEVILYCTELKLAGTIDFILVDKRTGILYLGDWKTNKKIDVKSYQGKKGSREATQNLDDCKLNRYAIQLSLYRYLLEKNFGLRVDRQALVHLQDQKSEVFRCEYLIDNVKMMLNDRMVELN